MNAENNNDRAQNSESLPMNMVSQQYVFTDRIDAFDPNLVASTNYNTQIQPNTVTNNTVIAPFDTLTPQYNDVAESSGEISLVASSELPNNCITYGNMIFVPSISNDAETSTKKIADQTPFKCVLSSDSNFLNTFIENSNIEASNDVLCRTTTDPSSNIISTINGNDLIVSDQSNQQLYHTIDPNQVAMQSDQEVILQDEHGHLYRQVPNMYVDGTSMCSSELLPVISAQVDISDVDYGNEMSIERVENTCQSIPVNFITSSGLNVDNSNALGENSDMQQVEFILQGYRDNRQLGEIDQMNASNQYRIESTSQQQNYQSHIEMHTNKEQQRLLENTMSTLLAAVNDITAREKQLEAEQEAQFQSYLNTSKSSEQSATDYYSGTESIPPIYTTTASKTSEIPTETPKSMTLNSITNDLFTHSGRDSPTDEYVDINEMEFIEQKNERGQREENVLMRRSRRKKTTKRKDDELLILDKFVPSRASASLPTSYLYFETANGASNRHKQKVLAKRQIPLQMKFGPVVGETKTLCKKEIQKYRELNPDYPLLFLGQNSIIDVSNENTSNWMRFVRFATKHSEQNLLLCDIDANLYFKCCKFIAPKQELRVGYSKEYAKKYNLKQLFAESVKKCDEKTTQELAPSHQIEPKPKESKPPGQLMPRVTPTKNSDSLSPTKSKDRLNTGAIRMRKLALSKTARASGPIVRYACCYCTKVFSKFLSYKKHTNVVHSVNIEHKRVTVDAEHKRLTVEDSGTKMPAMSDDETDNAHAKQLFVCQKCQQQFSTAKELEEHHSSECNDKESLVQCHVCLKHFQTPSALTMHVKIHTLNSENGLVKCPFCPQRYQSTTKFMEHAKTHAINGMYTCPHCQKQFSKYKSCRKHMKLNHSTVRFVCHECGSSFKSKYKLKEHSLRHSDVREFSCADCDKQFKRKDKLREHILRVHAKCSPSKKRKKPKRPIQKVDADLAAQEHSQDAPMTSVKQSHDDFDGEAIKLEPKKVKTPTKPKFQPKVPPTEYERFIYKCQHCMLGFKRRGMLVNHIAKRHPDIRIDSIHELNLPILKTERCYYCQYCEKVYKSSSKRKLHILKNHPGQNLPISTRYRVENYGNGDDSRVPDASFSSNIGSVTIHAHQCIWCYKQYASRSRLLQHKRKEHSKKLEESYKQSQNDYFKDLNVIVDSHEAQFQSQAIDEYSIRFGEINENVPHVHRFHHIEYEPENRLLELSSAALEASIRDDYSFLSDSDVNTDVIGQDIMDTRVDVNFKCDSNTLPQLFDGFLQ